MIKKESYCAKCGKLCEDEYQTVCDECQDKEKDMEKSAIWKWKFHLYDFGIRESFYDSPVSEKEFRSDIRYRYDLKRLPNDFSCYPVIIRKHKV